MLDAGRPALDLWIQAGRRFGHEIPMELLLHTIGISKKKHSQSFSP